MLIHKIIEFLSVAFQENWLWIIILTILSLVIIRRFKKIIFRFIQRYKWEISVFSITIFFFGSIIINQSWVDVQLHCYNLSECLEKGSFPGYPLYFFMLYALSGFKNDTTLFIISSGVLLSFLFVFKYYTIKQYFKVKQVVNAEAIIFLLCFISVIFYSASEQYIGKYSLTCFHNSTSIPLLPLSILIILYSVKYLKNESDSKLTINLFLCSSISMLIKPSFMMIYLPVFFLFILIKKSDKILNSILIFLPCIIILALEYFFIFATEQDATIESQLNNGIAFGWLDVWNKWSPSFDQKLIDVLMPIIFPVIYLISNPNARKGIEFNFLLFLFIFSFLFANIIYEDSNRLLHGNFMWHLHIINVLLFLYCVRDWLMNKSNFSSLINRSYLVIIVIHAMFGLLSMCNFVLHGMRWSEWFDVHNFFLFLQSN